MKAINAVLVHGAFHGGWCWERLVGELEERGLDPVAVDLPFTSFADDVDCVVTAIGRLDPPVLVVGHSYGGAVITSAGGGRVRHPGAAHLVYVAALMQDPDESFELRPTAGMSAIRVGDDGAAVLDPGESAQAMYHRSPPETAAWAVSKLRSMRMSADASERPRGVAWSTRPSTYVVCSDDRAIDPDDQRRMAKHADDIVEIDADHSPFFCRPKELADILRGVADGL